MKTSKQDGTDGWSASYSNIAVAKIEIKTARLRESMRCKTAEELLYEISRELFQRDYVQGAYVEKDSTGRGFTLVVTVAIGHHAAEASAGGEAIIMRELYRPNEK